MQRYRNLTLPLRKCLSRVVEKCTEEPWICIKCQTCANHVPETCRGGRNVLPHGKVWWPHGGGGIWAVSWRINSILKGKRGGCSLRERNSKSLGSKVRVLLTDLSQSSLSERPVKRGFSAVVTSSCLSVPSPHSSWVSPCRCCWTWRPPAVPLRFCSCSSFFFLSVPQTG